MPPGLQPLDPDKAITEIVDHLFAADDPNLVITIHGYNNPQRVVLESYASAFEAVTRDDAILDRPGLVCVGYRWPSERIGEPKSTAFFAAPRFLIWIFVFGILFLLLASVFGPGSWLPTITSGLGAFLLAISITAFLLRISVYFRDGYRATSYGIPDLVEIIRQIDRKLDQKEEEDKKGQGNKRKNWVKLSFIGHSMGGYVVTSVVRILSDVFSPPSVRPELHVKDAGPTDTPNEEHEDPQPQPDIGNVFRLTRLMLVSPDIPAEALISNRANFLASSLRRFEEAYLFSNEGDEVLRQISTTANYFSFPTRSRDHGYRLGNVGILASGYGIIGGGIAWSLQPWSLQHLRIGYMTLQQMYDKLSILAGAEPLQTKFPKYFTYFDCTDYVESGRGVLTLAKPGMPNLVKKTDHFFLLLHATFWGRPDVHGGYFDGEFSRELIYRLVCLGFNATANAYGGIHHFSARCNGRQIKALLSPNIEPATGSERKKATSAVA
jgi:Putative serine esterase (DUF676)